MVNKIEISPETITGTQESGNFFPRQSEEFMAQCPSCKTIETVAVDGDSQLITTRKFYQSGRNIYHKCGSTQPCRLFRGR
jgi:phage FluMu protein Com